MDLLNKMYTRQDPRKVIPAEEIFGEDADLLQKTCEMILHNVLHPYEGCPTLVPLHVQIRMKSSLAPEKAGFMDRYLAAITKWQNENPKEAKEILQVRGNWEKERDKQLVALNDIANRHGVVIEWHGGYKKDCRPDKWEIYRDGKAIAQICL